MNQESKKNFINYLCNPDIYLKQSFLQTLSEHKARWENSVWHINIMTFNYTHIIEKLLEGLELGKQIGTHGRNIAIHLQSIVHIHGDTDNEMVMGVDNVKQILNEEFHTNVEIQEAIMKPSSNAIIGSLRETRCELMINSSNIIYIFGSSIGETDRTWWRQIGERLKKDCKLVIFHYADSIPSRMAYKKGQIERQVKKHFLAMTELSNEEKQLVERNIFVGVNTSMFSNIISNIS